MITDLQSLEKIASQVRRDFSAMTYDIDLKMDGAENIRHITITLEQANGVRFKTLAKNVEV